jgi:predicted lipid carrier protein YhbT
MDHALLLLQRAALDAAERGDAAALDALAALADDPDALAEFARSQGAAVRTLAD